MEQSFWASACVGAVLRAGVSLVFAALLAEINTEANLWTKLPVSTVLQNFIKSSPDFACS